MSNIPSFKVTSKIEKFGLFTTESLNQQAMDSRELSIKVLDFVASHTQNERIEEEHPLSGFFAQSQPSKLLANEVELEMDGSASFPSNNLIFTKEKGLMISH